MKSRIGRMVAGALCCTVSLHVLAGIVDCRGFTGSLPLAVESALSIGALVGGLVFLTEATVLYIQAVRSSLT